MIKLWIGRCTGDGRLPSDALPWMTALLLSTVASLPPLWAQPIGFDAGPTANGVFEATYRSVSVFGKLPRKEWMLAGNIGQVCLDRGAQHVEVELAEIRTAKQGDTYLWARVRLLEEARGGSTPCRELAAGPKTRKQLKRAIKAGLALSDRAGPIMGLRLSKDAFDGSLDLVSTRQYLGPRISGSGEGTMELNPRLTISSTGGQVWLLVLRFAGPKWIFIEDGESLRFRLGERQVAVRRLRYDGDIRKDGTVVETAVFAAGRELIRELALSDEALVRVVGEKSTWDFRVSDKNQSNLLWFLDRASSHVPPRSAYLFSHPVFQPPE